MQTITHELVTTRKPHRCFGCVETFPARTLMHRHVWRDDGIHTAYWCVPCQAFLTEAIKRDPYLQDDGVEEGWVRECREEQARQEAKAAKEAKDGRA